MLKSTHPVLAGFRGGGRPREAALAVVLGLLGGMICGWNLSVCLVVVAAIALNLPTRLYLAASLAGGTMAWFAAEVIRSLGVSLLDQVGLGRAVAALGDGPIVALLRCDDYAVAGGAAMALAISLPAACLAAAVAAYRRRGCVDVHAPWLRPCGAPVALAVAAAAMAAPWWLGPKLATDELLRQFTAYNAAEVSATDVQLSLWTGKFVLRDLRIADPAHLDRDRLRIGRVVGQLSPGELIRRRLQVDKVSLEHLRADAVRSELARAADEPLLVVEVSPIDEPLQPDERQIDMASYVHHWPVVRHDLAWLEWLASAVERLADAQSDGDASAWISKNTARSDLGVRRPHVFIHRLSASDLASSWRLGRKSLIELTDLTSDPGALKQQPQLRLVVPQLAAELSVQFQVRDNQRRHQIKWTAYDLDLAQMMDASQSGRGQPARGGKTNVTGEGWMNREHLELPLQIETPPHELPFDGPGRFAGVEHELWRKCLSRLDRLRIAAVLHGPWTAPALTVDSDRLIEQVKTQLGAAGEMELVQAINLQLARPAEHAGAVMQASASESEPASPGISQLSDDVAAIEVSPGPDPPAAAATLPGERTVEAPRYPSTTTPYAQSAASGPQQPEAEPGDSPPTGPYVDQQTVQRFNGRQRSAALPGPVNLFVGSDPIASARAAANLPATLDPPLPAASPTWPGDAPNQDFPPPLADAEQPGTVVRQSFLARWSGVLRERFKRSARVPEPEPIDDLAPPFAPPPFAPPPFDAPQPEGSLDEPGMPAGTANRPWYKRMWR